MHRNLLAAAIAIALPGLPALAQDYADMAPRDGWRVIPTDMSYADLLASMTEAVPAAGMGLVTEAGPTEVAAQRGVEIPGNRVMGVFNNVFAVRTLEVSTAAMIEAPIRFYVTENADDTATLSWKPPSAVFAPYMDDGGDALAEIAGELDAKFEEIAAAATDQ